MIGLAILAAAAVQAPRGLDPSHIPMGSPLGAMPIVVTPGEPVAVLAKPMSDAQWEKQQRARVARAMKNPRARAIARWVAENERREAAREAAVRAPE